MSIRSKEVGKVATQPLPSTDWKRAVTKHAEAISWKEEEAAGGGGGDRTG